MLMYDAVVVGAGPNGLAAAIEVARAGHKVAVVEAAGTIGGGLRSAELTLPGLVHDVCAAVHPFGAGSPFMRSLKLADHGVDWVHPPVLLGHPLDDGTAASLLRSVADTAQSLGEDARAYHDLMAPLIDSWDVFGPEILRPMRIPRHPLALARFGRLAVRSCDGLFSSRFRTGAARALMTGIACHSMLPPDRAGTASFGLLLALMGHVFGWPLARGGSQRIADAMVAVLRGLGGEVFTGRRIDRLQDLPKTRTAFLDLTPRDVARVCAGVLPDSYCARLNKYRYGPGVFKIDWALDGRIPWRAPVCGLAGTVHAGGTAEEIGAAERQAASGVAPSNPFVLLSQPTLFDATRTNDGLHIAWAYCHVPSGSEADMTERIEEQIERFAPGFRERVVARHTMNAKAVERYNPNYVGGDINGGLQDLAQLFTRPVPRWVPYTTPDPRIFICSSSTPPGGGVHGLCGLHAAHAALRGTLAIQPSFEAISGDDAVAWRSS